MCFSSWATGVSGFTGRELPWFDDFTLMAGNVKGYPGFSSDEGSFSIGCLLHRQSGPASWNVVCFLLLFASNFSKVLDPQDLKDLGSLWVCLASPSFDNTHTHVLLRARSFGLVSFSVARHVCL